MIGQWQVENAMAAPQEQRVLLDMAVKPVQSEAFHRP